MLSKDRPAVPVAAFEGAWVLGRRRRGEQGKPSRPHLRRLATAITTCDGVELEGRVVVAHSADAYCMPLADAARTALWWLFSEGLQHGSGPSHKCQLSTWFKGQCMPRI